MCDGFSMVVRDIDLAWLAVPFSPSVLFCLRICHKLLLLWDLVCSSIVSVCWSEISYNLKSSWDLAIENSSCWCKNSCWNTDAIEGGNWVDISFGIKRQLYFGKNVRRAQPSPLLSVTRSLLKASAEECYQLQLLCISSCYFFRRHTLSTTS